MTAVTAAERILMGLGISDPKGNRSRGHRVEPRGARRIPPARRLRRNDRRLGTQGGHRRQQPQRARNVAVSRSGMNWAIGIITEAASCSAAARTSRTPRMTRSTPNAMQTSSHPTCILPNYLLHPRLRKIKRMTLAVAREIGHEFSASLTATLAEDRSVQPLPTHRGLPQ